MTKPTCVTLFSGGGLKAIGALNAGFDLVGAVEYDESIAAVYAANLGPNITVGKVEETDPTPYIGITALLASPVCTRMSVANANRGETEIDIVAAEGVCHWLRVTKPKIFVCENVPQYRASVSCKMIETCLSELGYFYTADNINCADYGVPQSRRRLIIRALLGSMVPALPVPEPHIGWYEAIEDLIPTLPESKFADWQLKRLPNDLFDSKLVTSSGNQPSGHPDRQPVQVDKFKPCPAVTGSFLGRTRALLIEGDAAGDRPPTCRTSAEPCFTLKTSSGGRVHRAFLMQGRIVSMTPRALGRFQTLPDWYVLPEKKTLASKIIGNGFPCLAAEKILRQLAEAIC